MWWVEIPWNKSYYTMKSMIFSLSAPLNFESLFRKRFAMSIALTDPLLWRFPVVLFELASALVRGWWTCEWRFMNCEAIVEWCVLCCTGTFTGILDETIGETEWNCGKVEMNWVTGPERLMGVAGGARTMGVTGRARAIVRLFSCNWEHPFIIGRIAAFYWFNSLSGTDLGKILTMWK